MGYNRRKAGCLWELSGAIFDNRGTKVKVLNFQDFFRTQLNAFLQQNGGAKTAVFFRGFGPRQNADILSLDAALSPAGILNSDGTLNLAGLDARGKKIADDLLAVKWASGWDL